MAIPKPVGPHAQEMLAGGGWPELDEGALTNRAAELMDVLRQVTSVSESWLREQTSLFSPAVWSGSASTAAAGKVTGVITSLQEQQMSLATAILWYQSVASAVATTKSGISEIVNLGHWLIAEIEATAAINPDAESQVQEVIDAARQLNTGAVTQAAVACAPTGFNPPLSELNQLVNQSGLPMMNLPGLAIPSMSAPMASTPGGIPAFNQNESSNDQARNSPPAASAPSGGGSSAPSTTGASNGANGIGGNPISSGTQPVSGPAASSASGPVGSPPGGMSGPPSAPAAGLGSGSAGLAGPATAGLGGESSSAGGVSAGGGGVTAGSATGSGSHSPASGHSPTGTSPGSGASGGSVPHQAGSQSNSIAGRRDSPYRAAEQTSQTNQASGSANPSTSRPPVAPTVAPAAASGTPGQPVPGSAMSTRAATAGPVGQPSPGVNNRPGSFAAPAPGTGTSRPNPSVSPTTRVQGGAGPIPRPIGAGPSAGSGSGTAPLGPPPTPAPAGPVASGPTARPLAGPPDTPVTAESSSMAVVPVPVPGVPGEEGRIRSTTGTADPLHSARRIAAALNAEDRPDMSSPGFFWATGVTTDGQVLVANSYGLGYIPSGQRLPRQARLVTLDHSIPVADRVSWASWPWRALAGWARSHDVGLRTIIGIEEHLRDIDVDAPQMTLSDDQIPATSEMAGSDRLELIAPAHAKRLVATADDRLITLLPPPLADSSAPPDRLVDLWSAVGAPMSSDAPGREIAQLQALLAYADHSEELAIHRAYAASDPVLQRSAIADGLYWHNLAGLTHAALNSGFSPPS